MPPRRKIVVSFDSAPKRKRAGLPLRYDVTVTLKDSRGNKHTEQYIADMAHMFSLSYTEEQTVHHVARALQGIQQLLTRSTGSKGRLQVDTHDLDRETLDSEVEEFLIGDPSNRDSYRSGVAASARGEPVLPRRRQRLAAASPVDPTAAHPVNGEAVAGSTARCGRSRTPSAHCRAPGPSRRVAA